MTLTRRQFLSSSSFAIAGTALARLPLYGQASAAPPVTSFKDLRGGVGIFTGQGGTIGYLVTPDGALVVDSQFPQTAEACAAGLKGRAPKGIEFLINTHHHGDHVAGNPAFRPAVRTIVQHEQCARLHRQGAEKDGSVARHAFADVTFAKEWSQEIGREKVWAVHGGPAHTGGDAFIFFEKANVMHMGDLMFNRVHPFIDRAAGASIRNWIAILESVARKHGDAVYVFGHGKEVTGTAKDVAHFRDYLSAVLEYTQKQITAGRSLEETVKLESLPGFADHASPIPILTLGNVLKVAYAELTEK